MIKNDFFFFILLTINISLNIDFSLSVFHKIDLKYIKRFNYDNKMNTRNI